MFERFGHDLFKGATPWSRLFFLLKIEWRIRTEQSEQAPYQNSITNISSIKLCWAHFQHSGWLLKFQHPNRML